MTLSTEDLLKRSKAAWDRKQLWDALYRDASKYGMPQRNQYETPQEGASKGSEVFDSTAIAGNQRFANRLQSNMCPAFQRWMQLEMGPLAPKAQRNKGNKLLQQVTDLFFAVIDTSNFATSANESFQDLGLGTGALFIEEDRSPARPSPVNFIAVPPIEIAIGEGAAGNIEDVFRRRKVIARLVKSHWKDAKVSSALDERIRDKPEEELEFEECSWFDADDQVYLYDVVWKAEKASILKRPRRYKENPWIVFRWMKASNEVFGRGPLIAALPDIKTLNKLVELILKNASLAVSGVWTGINDGVLNPATVRIVPGAVIPVAQNAGTRGPSLQALTPGSDFNVAQLELQDMRDTVKKLLFDKGLPPDQGPVRSATEIAARIKELSEEIGSAFGRLMNEFINPLVRRVLGIMERAGYFQEVGEVARYIDGFNINTKVTSPLARLQNASDIQALIDWLQILQALGPELGPAVVALGAKIEDIPEWAATKLGVPAELVRDEADKAKFVQGITDAVAKMQMAAQPAANGAAPPQQQAA